MLQLTKYESLNLNPYSNDRDSNSGNHAHYKPPDYGILQQHQLVQF